MLHPILTTAERPAEQLTSRWTPRTCCRCDVHRTVLTVMQVAKAKAAAEARRQAERAELERLAAERRATGHASPSPERQASPSQAHAVAVSRGSRDDSRLLHCMQPRRHTPCWRAMPGTAGPAGNIQPAVQSSTCFPACLPGHNGEHACPGRGLWVGLLAACKWLTQSTVSLELLLVQLHLWLS